MSPDHLTEPAGTPPGLLRVVRAFIDRYGDPIRWARTEVGEPWVLIAHEHVGYLGHDEISREKIRREEDRIRWAESRGIPVPRIVDTDANWLVTERVPLDEPAGTTYVRAAIEAADRIHAAEPPAFVGRLEVRNSLPRRTLPLRALRMVYGRLDPREFVVARRKASQLPRNELSHGDFHPRNVLFDSRTGRVNVIDWGYLGFQPRNTDLLLMWTQLRAAGDRRFLLETILQRDERHDEIAVLARWLALRSFADVVSGGPIRRWDPARVRRARTVIEESRLLEGEVGASPTG